MIALLLKVLVLPYTQPQVCILPPKAGLCHRSSVLGTHRDLHSQLQGMAQALGEPQRVGAIGPQRAQVGS